MTVREYIGARYVPLFIGDWDDTVTYEPLSIVQYQGNSYTSRQYVPTGIEITNTAYWALTGNYNAQIEQYRQEVEAYSGRIDDIEGDVSDLNNAVDTLEDKFPIETDSISNNAITSEKLSNASVTSDKLDSDAVTTSKLADESVTTNKLADNSVTTDKLADSSVTIDKINFSKIVLVEDYGAVGDGVTDCTSAIQAAIDANPNSQISFKGGIYIISDTIFVDSDLNGVSINLNGSIVQWNGANSTSWSEGDAWNIFDDHDGILSYPNVMFAVERRATSGDVGGECVICNGTIDANFRAAICVQSVGFYTTVDNCMIRNFQYAGIFIGTIDGQTYDRGTAVSSGGASTQNRISNCHLMRNGDMSQRNTSAIFVTFPDNNFSNIVTNRTMHGMTVRVGGNSIENSHFTAQFASWPTIANWNKTSAVRVWPFNAGIVQLNVFSNCYFNAMRYVVYTYHDENQNFSGANLRVSLANSHYTFYLSGTWEQLVRPMWYGGLWFGVCTITQCTNLYSDWTQMLVTNTPKPNLRTKQNQEISFANGTPFPHVHAYLFDAANYYNSDEWFVFSSSSSPVPANTYKRVAALVSREVNGAGNMIPGVVNFDVSGSSSVYHNSGSFVRNSSGNGYTVSMHDTTSAAMKMYVGETQTMTIEGITYYIAYIYVTNTSNLTETRMMKLESAYPYVEVYAYPEAYTNTGTESTMNQTIFDSQPETLYEIF